MNSPLMCHIVAGYPDKTLCQEFISQLASLGVEAIEVQIPFSDPIADGDAIMEANDVALNEGMTTASSFELLEAVRSLGITTDIYVMSYLQKIEHYGFKRFCETAQKCKIKGLIIPDLPYDTEDFKKLESVASANALQLMPVVSPGMSEYRLSKILSGIPGDNIYVTSRQGITGTAFTKNVELEKLVQKIRSNQRLRVFLCFGIADKRDIESALKIGDIAVIGSAIIRKIKSSDIHGALSYIKKLADYAMELKDPMS